MGETKNIKFIKLPDLSGGGNFWLDRWLIAVGMPKEDVERARIINIEIDIPRNKGSVYIVFKESDIYAGQSQGGNESTDG